MLDPTLIPLSGVTRDELIQRAKRFGEVLRDNGIHLAVVGYNPDLFYFTGSIQQGFVLINQDGEAIYLARKDPERARFESPIEKVQSFSRFEEVKDGIKQLMDGIPKRIALSFDVVPVSLFLRFKGLLGNVNFVDGSRLIRSCRMIKSPFEIRNIIEGIEIYNKTVEQMPDLIQEGMTEAEAEATLSLAMRRLGHQGIVRMRGWNQEGVSGYFLAGRSSAVPSFLDAPLGGVGSGPAVAQGAGGHQIKRNEPIVFDASPGVNGYVSDQTRTAVFGRLPPRLEEAYNVTIDMIHRFEAEAKPYDPCSEWFLKLKSMSRQAGLEDHFMGYSGKKVRYVGHGIGLELNEWPVLGEGLHWQLEPGMVLAVEPKMVFPDLGAVGIENDYLVTEKGVTRLTVMDDAIITL